jgi:UDP-N-acetyl-D-mannosaminuronate dehydrogenase
MPLISKIKDKTATIGVIGLGYVGLPLVIEFCRAGFSVTGFDVDEQKISLLRQGKSYIKHIASAILVNDLKDRFRPTSDFSTLRDMDCIIVCVPTPLNKNREPDMQYVFNTTQMMMQSMAESSEKSVVGVNAGGRPALSWIPACAGMTGGSAGVTDPAISARISGSMCLM